MMSIYCRNWWDLGYIRRLYILEGFYWENELARVFYWKYVFGGVQQKDYGRNLPFFNEIRGILKYPMSARAMLQIH